LSPPCIQIPMPAATVHPTQRLRREPAALSASGEDPLIVAPRDRVSRQAHARSVDVVGSLVATVAISDHTGAGDLCAAVHMIRGGGRPLLADVSARLLPGAPQPFDRLSGYQAITCGY